jgi:hypothetical protein
MREGTLIRGALLHSGLVALLIAVFVLLPIAGRMAASLVAFVGLFLVAFLSAVGHSLSRHSFVWTYDNNPLICVLAAFVFYSVFEFIARFGGARWMRVAATMLFALIVSLSCWFTFRPKLDTVSACIATNESVPYLRGAKYRPEMAALLVVAQTARDAAGEDGTVLMLPSDPNVESWIARPRPRLSAAITYVDQYWDKYVDEDFARLNADPPDVIVIGPSNAMWMQRVYGHEDCTGACRLIELVKNDLLPRQYERVLSVRLPIVHAENVTMDIYIRTP